MEGNNKTMREALEEIYMLAQAVCDDRDEPTMVRHHGNRIERLVNAALAKPPKNCDLHNDVEGAWQDYKQFRRQTGEAIYFDMVHFWSFAKWLFAPAKREGEGDGK